MRRDHRVAEARESERAFRAGAGQYIHPDVSALLQRAYIALYEDASVEELVASRSSLRSVQGSLRRSQGLRVTTRAVVAGLDLRIGLLRSSITGRARVRDAVRRLRGERTQYADAFASVLMAALCHQRGDVDGALEALEAARASASACGMRLLATAADLRAAELAGGASGRARVRAAAERLRDLEAVNGLLFLPSAERPEACVVLSAGEWRLDRDGEWGSVVDGQTIDVGRRTWALSLPAGVAAEETELTPAGSELDLERVRLELFVSENEEYPTEDAFESVSAGSYHTCGVRAEDGEVRCWGATAVVRRRRSRTWVRFESVTAGDSHTCGIRAVDDKVVCWGSNIRGQAPPGPSAEAFKSVSAGTSYTCGIRAVDDKVVCWGNNRDGEAPMVPNADAFESVSAGYDHTCGVRASDAKVVCWGSNYDGQAPPGPSEIAFKRVSAGWYHTCGVRASDAKVVCWGNNDEKQAPTEPSADAFKSVSAGAYHTCGVRALDGKVVCWGRNTEGQAPTEPSAEAFKGVWAGTYHTCGVRASDDKVLCWGSNAYNRAPRP